MTSPLSVDQLGLAIETLNPISPSTSSYRPPIWPPPRDWICVENNDGTALSRWGDPVWDITPWAGTSMLINFGDGPKLNRNSVEIDRVNADLFRLAMTWRIWGFRGHRSSSSILNTYKTLKTIFSICSQNDIPASELYRYPRLIEVLAGKLPSSAFPQTITELNILLNAGEIIGFIILDAAGLAQLKASDIGHKSNQTEYIPPRIWEYQVLRLKEFINDYLSHKDQIEECFALCINAYTKNNVIERSKEGKDHRKYLPFGYRVPAINTSEIFYGPFINILEQFGLKDIFNKWVWGTKKGNISIRSLSAYLSMASYVGLAYTLNFTLARVSEGFGLKFNCFKWHEDELYGQVSLIEGETTKTIEDATALWVTSPSTEDAIKVMQSVANMRNTASSLGIDEKENKFLINYGEEPWGPKKKPNTSRRPKQLHYSKFVACFPLIFERDKLLITDEDLKIATAVTPTINKNKYQVGKPWIFSWHQLRRTGAVNMYASGMISDASLQLQMKHMNPKMTLSYGRGHTALCLNEEVRSLIVNAYYEALGKELAEVNTDRFISPHGERWKGIILSGINPNNPVNLITEKTAAHYEKSAREHQISFRRTVLGGCMKNGKCDGDCASSIADCAGGDGKSPCANVLFDKKRAAANQVRLDEVIKQIESSQPDTPRYRYLEQERRGLENYFAYIR
jgi:hypothetical protein